jgi:glycosyltransferase involved in cell wall biosynthesis
MNGSSVTGSEFATEGPSPRVSVITIFRNEERYLREAIESVVAQTWGDWELLLVDDGSTDRSSELARSYSLQWPKRIRYLQHPGHENRGMSASRNLGVRESKGELLAFLDGDDVFLPSRLERHVSILDDMPSIDMVQSDVIHWLSWQPAGDRIEEDYVRPCLCFMDRVLHPPLGLWTSVALPELHPGTCSITVRRKVVIELGGFEERFHSLYEDQVFLTKVYAQKMVYVLQDYLARYRIHPASTVETLRPTAHRAGSAWRSCSREFAAWRVQYLRALPDGTGLLSTIIDEAAIPTEQGFGRGLRDGIALARQAMKSLLEWILPTSAYRRILARRRRMAVRQTLRRYERLCHRAMAATMSCR